MYAGSGAFAVDSCGRLTRSGTVRGVMRLVGFAFSRARGPVKDGYLPLGDLTAVIGANDAGKSRLVRTFADVLESGIALGGMRAAIYARLDDTELPALLKAIDPWHPSVRPAFRFAEDRRARRQASDDPVGSTVEAVAQLYSREAVPEWEVVHRAVTASPLVAFQPGARPENAGWTVHWCTPPLAEFADEAADAIREYIERPVESTALSVATGQVRSLPGPSTDAMPIPVARLGTVPLSSLPRPVFVPTSDASIAAAAAATVDRLMRQIEWRDEVSDELRLLVDQPASAEDVALDLFDLASELVLPAASSRPAVAWTEAPAPDTLRLKGELTRACELMGAAATEIAPAFLTDRYKFHVVATPASVLSSDSPITFALSATAGPGTIGENRAQESEAFSSESAADGHRVWIQLALLEAIDALRATGAELESWAEGLVPLTGEFREHVDHRDRLAGMLDDFDTASESEGVTLEGLRASLDEVESAIATDLRWVAEAAADYLNAASDLLGKPLAIHEVTRPAFPAGHAELRVPFFLIDEPEQHLHPRAERVLADWLSDIVPVRRTQTLVITHSVAFVNRADTLAYVSRRSPAAASVRTCGAVELTALGEIASGLGLDRGELLAGVSIFLFVEGDSDKYVLESLFGDRVRRIGVAVFPVAGATQLAQIVDAHVLLRYSTAAVAVLLDNLDRREIDRLLTDASYREKTSRGKTEERAVAKLIDLAFAQDRHPTVLGIPVDDIFFLLDPAAIRETFAGRSQALDSAVQYRPYADHGIARAEYDQTHDTWTGKRWKRFLLDGYGIPYEDVSWYATVADRMRVAGTLPAALVEVVDALELLALNLREAV